jgi:hypothetical protein
MKNCKNNNVVGARVSTEGGDYIKIHNVNVSLAEGSLRVVLGDSSSEYDTCSPCTQLTASSLRCELPEGLGGKEKPIRLLSDMDIQTGILEGCVLDFAPPLVESVLLPNGEYEAPRQGNVSITVRGSNFGKQGALIFVNGEECTNLQHNADSSHREVVCTLPPLRVFQRTNTFILFQSNQFATYETFFYTICPKNQFQSRESGDLHYECYDCPTGKYSTGPDAYMCEPCTWPFYFSKHCEEPVMGIAMGCALGIIISVALVLFLRKYSEQRGVVKRQMDRLKAQKNELATRLHDIEMLSSAWVTRWDEIQIKSLIDRGAEGSVWRARFRGRFDVAVRVILSFYQMVVIIHSLNHFLIYLLVTGETYA